MKKIRVSIFIKIVFLFFWTNKERITIIMYYSTVHARLFARQDYKQLK